MRAILSYAPYTGVELLDVKNGVQVLKKDCWLSTLTNSAIVFIGRDDKKRVEIEMDISIFNSIKSNPLFIMKSEHLRRIRTQYDNAFWDFILYNVAIIDNDLDNTPLTPSTEGIF